MASFDQGFTFDDTLRWIDQLQCQATPPIAIGQD
jgi:hypothetical protein